MSRAEYARAYYWRTVEKRRESARRSRYRARLLHYLVRLVGQAVDEARA